jgi:hypothetical protein
VLKWEVLLTNKDPLTREKSEEIFWGRSLELQEKLLNYSSTIVKIEPLCFYMYEVPEPT